MITLIAGAVVVVLALGLIALAGWGWGELLFPGSGVRYCSTIRR